MKTIMAIGDGVAWEINKIEGKARGSFRVVVNDLLRRRLSDGSRSAARRTMYIVIAQHCGFRSGIDPLKMNALYNWLETEQFIERHSAIKRHS